MNGPSLTRLPLAETCNHLEAIGVPMCKMRCLAGGKTAEFLAKPSDFPGHSTIRKQILQGPRSMGWPRPLLDFWAMGEQETGTSVRAAAVALLDLNQPIWLPLLWWPTNVSRKSRGKR